MLNFWRHFTAISHVKIQKNIFVWETPTKTKISQNRSEIQNTTKILTTEKSNCPKSEEKKTPKITKAKILKNK